MRFSYRIFSIVALVIVAGIAWSAVGQTEHYVATVVGDGISGNIDGSKDVARFNHPDYLAVDSQGNLYVLEADRIRKVTPEGTVSTLGTFGFGQIHGITVGRDDLVYFSTGVEIKTITSEGVVSVVAGADSQAVTQSFYCLTFFL